MVFKSVLDTYPALEVLIFDQNYSSSTDAAFLQFLRSTHVRLIIVRNCQSECDGPELFHELCPPALGISGATLVVLRERMPLTWDYVPAKGCVVCDADDTAILCCEREGRVLCDVHYGSDMHSKHIINGDGCSFSLYSSKMRLATGAVVNRMQRPVQHLLTRTYAEQVEVQRRFYWHRLKPRLVEWAIGLQELGLPALVTQTIFEQSSETTALIPMFLSWNVITRVKHFLKEQ